MKILIVDDNRIQLKIFCTFLSNEGIYKVFTSETAECAMNTINREFPDVILLDYMLPDSNGIELCNKIRNIKGEYWPFIMMITADMDTEILVNSFNAGANDFMRKPANVYELKARLINARRIINIIHENNHIKNKASILEQTANSLSKIASTDALTQIYNRRYAECTLDELWSLFNTVGQQFCIINLDLDHFKDINDNYGHDVGDEVLIHFVNTVLHVIRPTDKFCRMGGEEFIVISTDVAHEHIDMLGKRIKNHVEQKQPLLNLKHKITVSIGASICGKNDNGWQDTYKRSDKALYHSKHHGRNRFTLYDTNLQ